MEPYSHHQLADFTRAHLIGWEQADVTMHLIEKGGSDRFYYRLQAKGKTRGPDHCVLMVYTLNRPDNKSFFASTEVLRDLGIRCPKVFHHDPERRLAWIEDLGRFDLWEYRHHSPEERLPLYQDALAQAAKLHATPLDAVPAALRSHLQADFDVELYMWEQNYFFDNFVKNFSTLSPTEIEELRQLPHFQENAQTLAALPRFLVHRDFQSQNVIVQGRQTWFIDHQGLRAGRPEYDVASLLYDPYVSFTDAEREDLCEFYGDAHPGHDRYDTNPTYFAMCACQRLMQALGAYGYLGLHKGKPAFLKHIPAAVQNLRAVLEQQNVLPGLAEALELRSVEDALASVA
jgi:hypothetical protein